MRLEFESRSAPGVRQAGGLLKEVLFEGKLSLSFAAFMAAIV